jgi:folate-binding protein YgfZ
LQGAAAGTAPERAAADLGAAQAAAGIAAASGYALLEVTGADAESFLHAQLSSDVRALAPGRAQLSTYNSPKGRVLATLLLWRHAAGFLLQVPADVAPGLSKRLAMYVLRSKVRLALVDERFLGIALSGPRSASMLAQAGLSAPGPFEVRGDPDREAGATLVLALPGERFQLLCTEAASAFACWERLCALGAQPVGPVPWRWSTVRSGIADVVPPTQDRYVPQMLNYDLLGAVSFNKGCYPGQEIVARTQYRGGTKRRTLLFHADTAHMPLPAQSVRARGGDAVGDVLAAAPAPGGGYDLLGCVHLDLAAAKELVLDTDANAVLQRLALPYPVPDAP